jgi:hypothetical protein
MVIAPSFIFLQERHYKAVLRCAIQKQGKNAKYGLFFSADTVDLFALRG